jgi:pimeloyl-ACP methyl ester carboxylesterase
MSMRPPSLAEWQSSGRHFSFRGHEIFFQRAGSGVPLLLVHGFPTASWDYYKLWPRLIESCDVIAPDLLGFGFSPKPRRHPYDIGEQAELCVALLRALGVERCHLLCHDYGDTVGQELLARHAERATPELLSVCMLNGGLFPEVHRPRFIQTLLASALGPLIARLTDRRAFERSMRNIFGPDTPPSPEELDGFWSLLSHGGGRYVTPALISYMAQRRARRERWVGALLQTRVKLRLINGVLDPVSGEHMARRLLELKPDADVVRLNVGHYPQIEAPEQVLAAWQAFAGA